MGNKWLDKLKTLIPKNLGEEQTLDWLGKRL